MVLLGENEWRFAGVKQSEGWEHYLVFPCEPWVLLFRRPLNQVPDQEERWGYWKILCTLSLTNFSGISFIATSIVVVRIRNVARVIRHWLSRANLCWSHLSRDLLHLYGLLVKFNFDSAAKVKTKAAVVVILHCNFDGSFYWSLPHFDFSKSLFKDSDPCFSKPKFKDEFIVFQFTRGKFPFKSLRF